jgi:hypothetical protein
LFIQFEEGEGICVECGIPKQIFDWNFYLGKMSDEFLIGEKIPIDLDSPTIFLDCGFIPADPLDILADHLDEKRIREKFAGKY